jgi:hypothetical protein
LNVIVRDSRIPYGTSRPATYLNKGEEK